MEHQHKKNLTKHFESSFHWNLWWSVIYEGLRIAHNLCLAKYLSQTAYGLIGTIFASMYLLVKCMDMGTAYSITPFFAVASDCKRAFKRFILMYSVFPLCISIGTGFLIASIIAPKITLIPSSLIPIMVAIIILETFRSFLRQLLHIAFKSQSIVIAEFGLFIGYLLIIWGSFFLIQQQLTPHFILIFFLLDAILAVLFLMYKTHQFYQTLSDNNEISIAPISWKRLLKLRLSTFFLRISTNLSTTNVLTPLFAIKFGLKNAGVFYLMSTIAMATQAIIKAAIGHPGNALFAQVKHQSLAIKQEAFSMLSSKFLMVVFGISIGLAISHRHLLNASALNYSSDTMLLIGSYALITLSDLFITLYEYFYILEESATLLCGLRCVEFLFFYGIVLYLQPSPLITLLSIFSIRGTTVLIMTLYAYISWRLVLRLSKPIKYLGGCVITLLIIRSLSSLI